MTTEFGYPCECANMACKCDAGSCGCDTEAPNRRYAMRYDDGAIEYVSAPCAGDAVAQRDRTAHKDRPHTITDLTALNEWLRGNRPRAGIHMEVEA